MWFYSSRAHVDLFLGFRTGDKFQIIENTAFKTRRPVGVLKLCRDVRRYTFVITLVLQPGNQQWALKILCFLEDSGVESVVVTLHDIKSQWKCSASKIAEEIVERITVAVDEDRSVLLLFDAPLSGEV